MSIAQLPRELVEADNLPTPPGVALEVMRLADKPDVEAEEIGRLIRTDPALTVRLLRAVNSASYGLPQSIDSVPRACALLGLQRTKTLALGFAVADALPVVDESSGLDLHEYWLRSSLTAAAAELMALEVHRDGADVAFVVGLLSELGRLVLASCLTSTYKTLLVEQPWPTVEFERDRLGFANTDVTATLLGGWNLPSEIVIPIAYRDRPDEIPLGSSSEVIRLCRIVASASILAREWADGAGSRGIMWAGDAASHYLHMSSEVFAGIVEKVSARVEDLSLFMDASPPSGISARRLATEASERLKASVALNHTHEHLTELLARRPTRWVTNVEALPNARHYSDRVAVILVTHERFFDHVAGTDHPERPARLEAALRGVDDVELGEDLIHVGATPASRDFLVTVHDPALLAHLESIDAAGGGRCDADTVMSAASWEAAGLAAGAGLVAIDSLAAGLGDSAFCAVRPPGHHATAQQSMGFCLLNNVAVTAKTLADQGERVLVVDYDAHHGNGTQDIFYDDGRVMFVSFHQWPLYPGTGALAETGRGAGTGSTLNIPLPPGTTGDHYRQAWDDAVASAVEGFAPTWLLLSAGFDGHRADPITDLGLTSGDIADMTLDIIGVVPAGRRIVFLEGGYDLDAVRSSTRAVVAALAGERVHPEPPTSGGPGTEAVAAAVAVHGQA